MDDLISRQAAIDAVNRLSLGEADAVRLSMRIADYLNRMPPAQPEIIRCKDCRFFHPRSVYGHGLCDVHCNGIGESEVVRGTYFCADAERKEE